MILIDNYDSFTYNIAQCLWELGVRPKIFENDKITISSLKQMKFKSIIISPGPGSPDNAGVSMKVIKEFHQTKKILGVCLGHQCIGQFFGAQIIMDTEPYHGKNSEIIRTAQSDIFKNVPSKFSSVRYHSLTIKSSSIKSPLIETAKTSVGKNMAIHHEKLPIFGVQFHPEAILSEYGKLILKNFAEL